MKSLAVPFLCLILAHPLGIQAAVLKRSDVAFMYQADRNTYANYGATVLAWGGKPTAKSLAEAEGVKFFGSVGMVTEFSRYYERFPQTYEQGLCRDVNGNPVKVPWLTDHQHKAIPYWWCCTRQPQFRQYLAERVVETIKAGAEGLHIDDHMGTAGGLWLGLCFCDRCVDGFRAYLKSLSVDELQTIGVEKPESYHYRDAMKQWLASDETGKRKPTQHPLWSHWTIYQCRAAAAFMQELSDLAAQTAGRKVPMGANAGLLWPRHLSDYKTLDLFSAETDHHAGQRRFSDAPLFAYRMADAVQRPYAATASGGDWAFIKEQNLPGLVRGWIALSYAAGHCFMGPHRQWCYTPQKGTHWYQGPAEKFAPLYQFVRRHSELFDEYQTYADVAVVLPHRSFLKNANRWFEMANQLTERNIAYRLLLAGDEIVDHPLAAEELETNRILLVPVRDSFLPADANLVEKHAGKKRVFGAIQEALAAVRPAVQIKSDGPVRVLPRVKTGSAVIHVLNYDYKAATDDIHPLQGVKVSIDAEALGISKSATCKFVTPESAPVTLKVEDGSVIIPALGLWGILHFK